MEIQDYKERIRFQLPTENKPLKIRNKIVKVGLVVVSKEKTILKVVKISPESETITRVDMVGKYISVFNRDGIKHQDAVFSLLFKNGVHWTKDNEENLRPATGKEIFLLEEFTKKDFLAAKQYGSN